MIFITLGTQDKPFPRLLEAISKLSINDKIIVQAGSTCFSSDKMEIFSALSKESFEEYIKKSDLLITHGGVGSILTGLKYNKKVIAIPRLKKYNEASNNHQIELVTKFDHDGYLIGCLELEKLSECLKKASTFKPKKYKGDTKNILNKLDEFISKH